MLSNIKNIVFDLGGVLIDLDKERCIRSFTAIGFPQAAELIDCYHPSEMLGDLERGTLSLEQVCDNIRNISSCAITNEQIAAAYSDFLVSIPIEKLRLLEALRAKGLKIYMLSNTNPLVFPAAAKMFEADGHDISYYFDSLYLSYEMLSLKPDREIYDKLIADSGIIPEQTLFIDDGVRNIEMGRTAGLQVYLAQAKEDFSHLFSEILA